MKLILHKPLVFFDIESTGLNITTDRIVEISIIKLFPDGKTEQKDLTINPTIPIPEKASSIHGIKDEDVKDKPTFDAVGHEIANFIKNCDFAGYNSNKFDVPLLFEELTRHNIEFDWSKSKFIDVQVIFMKKEPRTLSAAYKFYCDKNLENAHSSKADTQATLEVFMSQLERYPDLGTDVVSLSEFSSQNNAVDFAGRVILDEKKVEIFNFGKYKGRPVAEVFKAEPSYYDWMMKGDFASNTKQVITAIKLRSFGK